MITQLLRRSLVTLWMEDLLGLADITFDSNSFGVTLGYGESVETQFYGEGREAQTLSLMDFGTKPAEPTMVASFGVSVEEAWVAVGSEWSAYQDTAVIWDPIVIRW